jgi:mRNA interferase MazF
MAIDPKRGEVWFADFNPVTGSETGKARPCVVISEDALGRLPVRLVVPVTDWKPAFAGFVWMTPLDPTPGNGLHKESAADALQMRVASVERFQSRWGTLPADTLDAIAASIALCVGYKGEES